MEGTQLGIVLQLHIALAVFQTLDDERYIPFFEGVEHAATISFDTEKSL